MSNYNPAGGGLQYRGTAASAPPNCFFNRVDPTPYDKNNVSLLDLWLNTTTNDVFMLVSLAGTSTSMGSLATWVKLSTGQTGVFTLTGDSGGAIMPNANGNIDLLGNNPITIAGDSATNSLTASIATATTTQIGATTLADNTLTIAGTDTTHVVTPASLTAKLGTQTSMGVAYGNGTSSALSWTAAGTGGQVLMSHNSGVPAFGSLTSIGGTVTITYDNSSNTINFESSGGTGLVFIAPVRVATTANLNATYANGAAGVGATLTNAGAMAAISIDGVALSLNDRVLVKDQTSQLENGVYEVTTVGSGAVNWVLTRTTDYDSPAEILPGTVVPVQEGATNADTLWIEIETVTAVGTDPIVFIPFGTQGTLQVARGGTGSTSFTPYSVICAGTTATNPFQNVSGVGTSGQVLTSNGAGTLPTWQTPASGSGGVTVTTYTTPGTYVFNKQVSTKMVEVFGWGGGGGGCNGSGSGSSSGSGGGAGGTFHYKIPAAYVSAAVTVTVGAGGTAGTTLGGDGGVSYFGNMCTGVITRYPNGAQGTSGGYLQLNLTTDTPNGWNTIYLRALASAPLFSGGSSVGAPNRNALDSVWGNIAPTGGGAGGLPDASVNGGRGGNIYQASLFLVTADNTAPIIRSGGTGGTNLSNNGGAGNTGLNSTLNFLCGGTGGGGATGSGTGGVGGFPGGGGGGATTSGTAGAGGAGAVIVIEYA